VSVVNKVSMPVLIIAMLSLAFLACSSEYNCSDDYRGVLRGGEGWARACNTLLSAADFILTFPDGALKEKIVSGLLSSTPNNDRIELISVDYDGGNEVIINGIEKTGTSISLFMRNIEALGIFKKIEWRKAEALKQRPTDRQRVKFSLHLTIKSIWSGSIDRDWSPPPYSSVARTAEGGGR